jgi:TPR repeat protein
MRLIFCAATYLLARTAFASAAASSSGSGAAASFSPTPSALGALVDQETAVGRWSPRELPELRAAAEEGEDALERAAAQHVLATSYFYGARGLAKDAATAAAWFGRAARAGLAKSQYNLGVLTTPEGAGGGAGGSGDKEARARERERLLRAAAVQGHAQAQMQLSVDLYKRADGEVEADRARPRKGGALEESIVWLRRAAARGVAPALAALANAHVTGEGGVEVDHAEALALARRSADAGDAAGQAALSRLYAEGLGGLEKDAAEAERLLTLARETAARQERRRSGRSEDEDEGEGKGKGGDGEGRLEFAAAADAEAGSEAGLRRVPTAPLRTSSSAKAAASEK